MHIRYLLENENSNIRIKLEHQEEMLKKLVKQNEIIEEKSRRKAIRVYGVKEVKGENCKKVVISIISEKFELRNLKDSKIESCFRTGKYEGGKVRPILVKFNRLDTKNSAYKTNKLLKGSEVVIREDLTREKIIILKKTLEKIGNTGKVWT